MTFCILVCMLMFISLHDRLPGLDESDFAKARTLLKALSDIFSLLMIMLRGTLALHRSTATLFSLFLEVFVYCSILLFARKCDIFTFT
jgi:hypothetical protein